MHLGIDGCPAGWYVARRGPDGLITGQVYASFAEILRDAPPPSVIAVDIPIGLTESGSRECDVLARSALAPRRSASVFPAPLRCVLEVGSHAEASAMRREREGKGMSIQSFAITKKVREVDLAIAESPAHHDTVHEVHPEVCFRALNGGQSMTFAKKNMEGRGERLRLLSGVFGDVPARLIEERVRRDVGADDVVDALVALWSAMRIARGEHGSLPAVAGHDSTGRRMAIAY